MSSKKRLVTLLSVFVTILGFLAKPQPASAQGGGCGGFFCFTHCPSNPDAGCFPCVAICSGNNSNCDWDVDADDDQINCAAQT